MDSPTTTPPPPPSPAAVPPGGTKEGPAPHSSKRILILTGLTFLTLGILMGVFGTQFFNQSTIIPSPSPTPLPGITSKQNADPTADWNTYTNEQYNFSLKHPNDWQGGSTDDSVGSISKRGGLIASFNKDKKNIIGINRFDLSELPKGYSNVSSWFDDLLQKNPKALLPNDGYYYGPGSDTPFKWYMYYTPENFTNLSSVRYQNIITSNTSTGVEYIVIPHEPYIFQITLQPIGIHDDTVVDQILSTFRFIDTTSPTPTTIIQSTPAQANGAASEDIVYTLPANWTSALNANGLYLAPKTGGGFLNIEVFNYPGTTGRRDYYCQLHKYCIAETVFTETTIGNISGYLATRLDNSGGGEEYFGAKGNKFYIISTYSPPAPNDFVNNYKSVLSSLTF